MRVAMSRENRAASCSQTDASASATASFVRMRGSRVPCGRTGDWGKAHGSRVIGNRFDSGRRLDALR